MSVSECSVLRESNKNEAGSENDNPSLKVVLAGHKKPVTSVAFQPNDLQFASASEDHSVMLWKNASIDISDTKNIRSYSFLGHKDSVKCLEYSKNGDLIASCSKDMTVRLWVPTIRGGCEEFKASTSSVNTLCFSPNRKHIITGSNDKSVKLWDYQNTQFIQSYLGHNNGVNCAKISPNDDFIISCSDDHTVRIWDKRSSEQIHSFVTPKSHPKYIAIHPGNETVSVAMDSGSVRVYNIPNRKLQQHYSVHNETTCVDWHPFANYLLSCGKDGQVKIIDIMEGRPLYTISAQGQGINSCRFSDNGEFFALARVDKTVMIWKTNFI